MDKSFVEKTLDEILHLTDDIQRVAEGLEFEHLETLEELLDKLDSLAMRKLGQE